MKNLIEHIPNSVQLSICSKLQLSTSCEKETKRNENRGLPKI